MRRSPAQYLLILLSVFYYCTDLAGKDIQVGMHFSNTNVGKDYLEIAEDKSKSLSFEDAQKLNFQPSQQEVPNFGFNNSSFWLRFTLENTTDMEIDVYVSVKNANLDIADLYYFSQEGGIIRQTGGDFFKFSRRVIKDKYVRFPVKLAPKSKTLFYLNAQNSGEQFSVPVSIGNETYFANEVSKEQIIFGIYFGIIVLALILNIFFSFILKDRTSWFYVAYLAGLLFLQLSLTGIGFQYIWPESIFLANHANPIFANLSILFLILFTISFLNIHEYFPRLAKFYTGVALLVCVTSVLAWIDNPYTYITSVLSINVVALLLNVMIIPTAWKILKKGYKPARFFIVAFVILIVSVFIFVMKNFGIAPSNFITEYGIQIGSALEVSLLSLAVIDRFKQFKDQALDRMEEVNRLKTEANIVLEKKVEERTAEINHQKIELQQKNKEITDSINYAKRIQSAYLPPDAAFSSNFPDSFLIFQPKDIVSGDFYWSYNPKAFDKSNIEEQFFAVADCTGHGVPGALMSVICCNAINEVVISNKVYDPGQILTKTRDIVIRNLKSSNDDGQKDGMDISLCSINYRTGELKFAGANNPICIYRKDINQIEEIAADKQPVGVFERMLPFTTKSIQLQKGDVVFAFSDGYADQFGGPKGKKFKYKKLYELFRTNASLPMQEQKDILLREFHEWKGSQEQVDDICLIGVRF
ncbi:MAG: hypothetical protein Fur0041_15010 [Bacteroidia bacterium]